jgi:hypothetical protein
MSTSQSNNSALLDGWIRYAYHLRAPNARAGHGACDQRSVLGSRHRPVLRDASASETIASMPRLPVRAAVALLAFCLLAPAAHADGLETLHALAKRHLRPARLVPTAAPRPLSELGVSLSMSSGRGRRGYGLRLAHYTPAINLAIQGNGTFDDEACDTGPMSVSAERRDPI